jgi:DNA topoisomerase 2-associated protein PAT1
MRGEYMSQLSTPPLIPLVSVPHPVISLLKSTKGKRVFHRVMRQLEMADRLDLLICIVNNFTQLDVVADSQLLDQPDANAERRELERQTHLFLQSVWQPLVTLILELSLPPIIHMLSALLQRADLVRLVSSKVCLIIVSASSSHTIVQPGIILLTSFFAQVENIKQNIAEGAAVPAEDLARWQWIYNEWFDVLSPHLVGLFPSTRLAMNLPFGAEPYLKPSALTDAMDLPIWKFLATFSIHASLEQQQVLVTVLRDKVLENLVSASKGWNTEESVRRVANVNQVCFSGIANVVDSDDVRT